MSQQYQKMKVKMYERGKAETLKRVFEIIGDIILIENDVGSGIEYDEDKKMFRIGYENGRKGFITELTQKLKELKRMNEKLQ